MRRTIVGAAGALAASVVAANAMAQSAATPEVTVESSRVVETTIGQSSSGIPIKNVSMGYTVSAKGLDITSHIGATAFEARVKNAAVAACKELGRQYPNATPSDEECARDATAKAMEKVRQLEAAAARNASASK